MRPNNHLRRRIGLKSSFGFDVIFALRANVRIAGILTY